MALCSFLVGGKQQDTLHDWRLDERARKWFKNGIYSVDSGLSEEEIYDEIRNYSLLSIDAQYNTRARAWGRQPRVSRGELVNTNSLVENKIQSKNLMILLTDVVGKYLADTEEPVGPFRHRSLKNFSTLKTWIG